jgi:hypothetical protein
MNDEQHFFKKKMLIIKKQKIGDTEKSPRYKARESQGMRSIAAGCAPPVGAFSLLPCTLRPTPYAGLIYA